MDCKAKVGVLAAMQAGTGLLVAAVALVALVVTHGSGMNTGGAGGVGYEWLDGLYCVGAE